MSRTRRLLVVLALNLALVGALVAVGVAAHSLAVLAEGGDYLLDAAGVGVALLAIRLSARTTENARRPESDGRCGTYQWRVAARTGGPRGRCRSLPAHHRHTSS